MATQEQIRKMLFDFGLSKEEFGNRWDELRKTNRVVEALHKGSEENWEKVEIHLLVQVPDAYDKWVEDSKKPKEEEIIEEAEVIVEKSYKELEKEFLDGITKKIENKEKLTADECERLQSFEIEQETIDTGRWVAAVASIIDLQNGKFCEMGWSKGLTEYQDDEFESTLCYFVEKKKETKVVEFWARV